jgi:hypothetical protein
MMQYIIHVKQDGIRGWYNLSALGALGDAESMDAGEVAENFMCACDNHDCVVFDVYELYFNGWSVQGHEFELLTEAKGAAIIAGEAEVRQLRYSKVYSLIKV